MHLDTVFTLLDVDKATAYPPFLETATTYSLRPGDKPGTLDVHLDASFARAVAETLGIRELEADPHRRRRLPAGPRTVGLRATTSSPSPPAS